MSYTLEDWEYLSKCTLKVSVGPPLKNVIDKTFPTTIEILDRSAMPPFNPIAIKFKGDETFYNFYRIKDLIVTNKMD